MKLTQNQSVESGAIGAVFLASVISCFIAFHNNWPLVYPDTGSYMHSGWENQVFYDRSIFYGLFLYGVSFQEWMLLVVFAQGLLVCYQIYLLLGVFFTGPQKKYIYLGSITFLTLFTGFSYTVSILIPDIFSSITLLCLLNLLLNRNANPMHLVVTGLIFMFSICTQFSSIPILMLVFACLVLIFIYRKWRSRTPYFGAYRLFTALGLYLSTLFIIPAVHYRYDNYFKISGCNHILALNHLIETGILEDYLNKHCAENDFKLCRYKDSLGYDFVWSDNSPAKKTGGWEANRDEYRKIIWDVLSRKEYLKLLFGKGMEYSLKQYFTFQTTVSPPQLQSTAPYEQVEWRLPGSVREYICSRQSGKLLDLGFVNNTELPVILFSLVFLLVVAFTPALERKLTPAQRWTYFIVLMYSVISSVMCANLSTIHPRFQNRIVWLLPLCVFILIGTLLKQRKEVSSEGE